jgi:predicted enzyme related to lactoylglutathione lyase
MGRPVVHFEIIGKDADKSRDFYGKLFGWNYQVMPEMNYAMVDTDSAGAGIAGGIAGAQEGQGPMVTFYVDVEDPQKALDHAVALGGSVLAPVMTIPGMVTIAVFADPDGNPVGLVKSEAPQA